MPGNVPMIGQVPPCVHPQEYLPARVLKPLRPGAGLGLREGRLHPARELPGMR